MERPREWAYNLMERREEEEEGNLFEVIPHDLIIEILLRLPVKSVLRFRCVSKLCSSITSRPDFIKTFAARSSPRVCIVVDSKTKGFISLPPHGHEEEASCEVYAIPKIHPSFGYTLTGSKSVHGLMCLVYIHEFIVWNPTLRQHVTLPNPLPRGKCECSCFGYDPVEGKYKVLCIPNWRFQDDMMLPLVLTLGPQESWRVTQNSHVHFTTRQGRIGTCINGHVYYPAMLPRESLNQEQEHILVSFDVRYETFNTIKQPADAKLSDNCMLNYEGKLAWLCHLEISRVTSLSRLRFWVLEDEEKQEWSLREFLLPLPLPTGPNWGIHLWLLDITHDTGEFVYMEIVSKTIFNVWYYDPMRNLTRRIKYEDEALWMAKDLGHLNLLMVHYYPNHIESLMSLDNLFLENVSSDDSFFRDKLEVSSLWRTCPRRTLIAIILVLVALAFFLSMISLQVIQRHSHAVISYEFFLVRHVQRSCAFCGNGIHSGESRN